MKDPRETFGIVVFISLIASVILALVLLIPPFPTAQQTARCVEKCEALHASYEGVNTHLSIRSPATCTCSFELPKDGGIP